MIVLAIETSCDETAAAVVEKRGGSVVVLSNVVASQIDIHAATGGVVPDVASREHVRQVVPVVESALKQAGMEPENLDAVAVTNRPGLLPALVIGVESAKAVAAVWNKPLIPVHHIAGHIFANWIGEAPPAFPCLALVVSGGHTELVLMRRLGQFEKVGQALDDAAGEAFDKVARLLGLGYPGGPAISRAAEHGDPTAVDFPRALMAPKSNLDFSFSGLKTSVRYHIGDRKLSEQETADIAASFQAAAVDALVAKTERAMVKYKPASVVLAGGVAANAALREQLKPRVEDQGAVFFMPDFAYCTDNAAMIGAAAVLIGKKQPLSRVQAIARESLEASPKRSWLYLLTNPPFFRTLKK